MTTDIYCIFSINCSSNNAEIINIWDLGFMRITNMNTDQYKRNILLINFFPLYCDGSAYVFVHPTQKLVDASTCPSVCPHVSEQLQLHGFP
jgi:hypothetical protein